MYLFCFLCRAPSSFGSRKSRILSTCYFQISALQTSCEKTHSSDILASWGDTIYFPCFTRHLTVTPCTLTLTKKKKKVFPPSLAYLTIPFAIHITLTSTPLPQLSIESCHQSAFSSETLNLKTTIYQSCILWMW